MAGFIDSLVISIGLDTAQLEQQLSQLGAKIDSGLQAAVENASPAFDGVKDAMGAAGDAAGEFSDKVKDAMDGMADAGEKAAEAVGGVADATEKALQQLGVRSEAAVRAEMAKVQAAYEAVRTSATASDRDKALALEKTRQALQKLEAELRTQLPQAAAQGFGRMELVAMRVRGVFQNLWYQMIGPMTGVLAIGGAFWSYLQNVTAEERDFEIYTHKDAQEAEKFKKNLESLQKSADALFATFAKVAVPALNKLAESLKSFIDMLREHPEGLAAAAAALAGILLYSLLPPLSKLPKAIAAVGKAFMRWFPFVAVIMLIAGVIDDLFVYMEGGESALDDFWSIFGTGEEISRALSQAWKDLKQTGRDLFAGLVADIRAMWATLREWGVIDGLKNALVGLGHIIHGVFTDNWKEAVDGAKQLFGGLWDTLTGGVTGFVNTAISKFSGLWAEIKAAGQREIEGYVNSAKAYFSQLWSDIKTNAVRELEGYANAVWSAITGLVDRIRNFVTEKVSAMFSALPVPDFLKDALGLAEPETKDAGGKVQAGMAETAAKVKGGFNAAWTATANFAVTKFNAAAAAIKGVFAGIVQDATAQADRLALGAGAAALRAGGLGGRAAAQAQAGGRGGNTDASIHIGQVKVETRATDADGVARDMSGALRRHRLSNPAASGVNQK